MQTNDLKKEIKSRERISKYYRKNEEPSKFIEEDVESLEYRQAVDKIAVLHQKNYGRHAVALKRSNNLKDAQAKVQEALDKYNHKDFDTLMIKVDVLMALNKYAEVKQVLDSLRKYN